MQKFTIPKNARDNSCYIEMNEGYPTVPNVIFVDIKEKAKEVIENGSMNTVKIYCRFCKQKEDRNSFKSYS